VIELRAFPRRVRFFVFGEERIMELTGLHLLLTYQCNLECDHCFVWGSPWQSGVLTLKHINDILKQAEELGTVEWIYFEGGEPFLYYTILLKGVQAAASHGFKVGIVSNGYWATDEADAFEWLFPFAGLVQDLSISNDRYHWCEDLNKLVKNACSAAEKLGIPVNSISVAQPEAVNVAASQGQLPWGESNIMYRGRAAEKLVERADHHPWTQFDHCPHEDLRDPGRVHIDPFGNLHICQGIVLGNLFEKPLHEICADYDPESHVITGPLLAGGPAALAQHYGSICNERYADACHLCFDTRRALRERFPAILAPNQMYSSPD
jgi:MoaA/NifB/PqqE/SkfB family radical SAM enzyme